jgi:hypothetical protein
MNQAMSDETKIMGMGSIPHAQGTPNGVFKRIDPYAREVPARSAKRMLNSQTRLKITEEILP